MTSHSTALCSAVTCLAAAAAAPLAAQTSTNQPEIQACYDSRTSSSGVSVGSGIVYRINVPGVVGQGGCVDLRHTQFSWTIRHSALTGLSNDDHPQYLLANGTRALTGPLLAGGFKITDLAAGTAAGDAVRFEQVMKAGDAAGGDLSGTYPNPSVAQLQGRAVTNAAPSSGQVLSWTGTAWAPTTPGSGASGPAGGDLTGSYPNPTIARLLGGPFPVLPPTGLPLQGSVLTFGNGVWTTSQAAGDVSGPISGNRVTGLQGQPVDARSPLQGQVLTFSGFEWAPATPSSGASGVAGGDLTGTYPNPTIASGAVTTAKLADQSVTNGKLQNFTVTVQAGPGLFGGGTVALGQTTFLSLLPGAAPGQLLTWTGSDWATAPLTFGQLPAPLSTFTPINTPNTLVQRQGDGGFAAGPVTLTGLQVQNVNPVVVQGDMQVTGTLTVGNFVGPSDIRLKEEIAPLGPTLERLLKLAPISYRFREGTGYPRERRVGLSAQSVEPLFPELVRRGADGYLALTYGDLSAVLVKAVQEQQAEIETLRAELAALREELAHRKE